MIRTHLFFSGGLSVAGSFETLYTVPAGHRALVKYVTLFNGGAGPRYLFVALVPVAGGLSIIWHDPAVPAADTSHSTPLYAVADEGDEIVGFTDTLAGGATLLHVAGVLFEV